MKNWRQENLPLIEAASTACLQLSLASKGIKQENPIPHFLGQSQGAYTEQTMQYAVTVCPYPVSEKKTPTNQ